MVAPDEGPPVGEGRQLVLLPQDLLLVDFGQKRGVLFLVGSLVMLLHQDREADAAPQHHRPDHDRHAAAGQQNDEEGREHKDNHPRPREFVDLLA